MTIKIILFELWRNIILSRYAGKKVFFFSVKACLHRRFFFVADLNAIFCRAEVASSFEQVQNSCDNAAILSPLVYTRANSRRFHGDFISKTLPL